MKAVEVAEGSRRAWRTRHPKHECGRLPIPSRESPHVSSAKYPHTRIDLDQSMVSHISLCNLLGPRGLQAPAAPEARLSPWPSSSDNLFSMVVQTGQVSVEVTKFHDAIPNDAARLLGKRGIGNKRGRSPIRHPVRQPRARAQRDRDEARVDVHPLASSRTALREQGLLCAVVGRQQYRSPNRRSSSFMG